MKTLKIFQVIIVLLFLPIGVLYAQNISNKVHELYFQSVAYPERFNPSTGILKDKILACLVPLKNRYFQGAQDAINRCKRAFGGGRRYSDCLKNDPNASMHFWSDGMIQVINNQSTWAQTRTGRNMNLAKSLTERLAPGTWVRSIQSAMPNIQQMIQCP